MIPPAPGPNAASRLFGPTLFAPALFAPALFAPAYPADGAGPIGENQHHPVPIEITRDELMRGLNPLHYVPGVGMMYRAATGETIPAPMRVLGAALTGGPIGALAAGFMGILEAMLTLPPDTTRPSAPAGMSHTGSEAGVQPPGPLEGTAYTTLATVPPEWLPSTTTARTAYASAEAEWQRTQFLERGIA